MTPPFLRLKLLFAVLAALLAGCQPTTSIERAALEKPPAVASLATPAELYGELFTRVQLEEVYPDSKTFVDALPTRAPAQIMREYEQAKRRADFDLAAFVRERFQPPPSDSAVYRTIPGQDVREHIDRLWSVLERKPDDQRPYSSRLPLPERYIVPGGRFNEIYYWDSYFTMLGLLESGRTDLIDAMLRNFAHLIDDYGHIPNGNRTYYLSRSQPPFFAAMVELASAYRGEEVYREFLPQLQREYAFWMDGALQLEPGEAYRRVVRLDSGVVLNRYWDDRSTPREESYREDVATAAKSERPSAEVYRNLRAAAESGWDFSSRWLADGRTLATIRTVELVPPDLNSLMHQLEEAIVKGCMLIREAVCIDEMRARAATRKQAINTILWNEQLDAYTDYDWRAQRHTDHLTAATLYPLYFEVSAPEHAEAVANTVQEHLLQSHGLATTTVRTGQQWDAPNGWAPLQWIAVQGLKNYGKTELAAEIAERWSARNLEVFERTGKLVEKYDVSGDAEGGGGEYPLQDGFGWTNGVLRALLAQRAAVSGGRRTADGERIERR